MKKLLEIRLVCVEDGLDNTGFRKIAAFIKSIHSNTKVAYVPTANHRNLVGILMEKSGGNLKNTDIHKVAQFMAEGDIAAFSSMTQSSFTVYKIIDQVREINPDTYNNLYSLLQSENYVHDETREDKKNIFSPDWDCEIPFRNIVSVA